MKSIHKTAYIGILAVFIAALYGCGGSGPDKEATVLARVSGEPVTLEQLRYRLKFLNLGFTNMSAAPEDARDANLEALSQLIQETIFLKEAEKKGVKVPDEEVQRRLKSVIDDYPEDIFDKTLQRSKLTVADMRDDISRKLTIEKLIEAEVYSHVEVSDDEISRYFREHKAEFDRPKQVSARQIVVEDEELASGLHDRLLKGADFATTAKEQSLSPDGADGGDLGYFTMGEMPPEFEEVVFKLKPGQLSPVVQSPYGYHIFKVEDVREAREPKLDDVRDEVRRRVAATKGEDDYTAWIDRLRSEYTIEVEPDTLGKI